MTTKRKCEQEGETSVFPRRVKMADITEAEGEGGGGERRLLSSKGRKEEADRP